MKESVLIVVVNEWERTAFGIFVSEKCNDVCAETVITAFRAEIHCFSQNFPLFCFQRSPKKKAYYGGQFIIKDRERDILRKTMLEILAKGSVHYTYLDQKVCTICPSICDNEHLQIATPLSAKQQLHHPNRQRHLSNGI